MRLRHEEGSHCPLCEEKLKQAHSELQKWFQVIKGLFPDCHISCTYRGKEEQNFHFKQGMSKLQYPYSMHNKTDEKGQPCSRAIDLFQIRPDKVPCWQKSYFHAIAQVLKEEGAEIDWGWDLWQWDAPHFQLKKSVK